MAKRSARTYSSEIKDRLLNDDLFDYLWNYRKMKQLKIYIANSV